MSSNLAAPVDLVELDRIYREGGLRQMASPHIHYHESLCPHGCGHKMEWIDFQLELFGDRDGIYIPLVRAWWEGTGFVGRCPHCRQWIHFTTLGMHAVDAKKADSLPHLPDDWHTVAQFG
jgi:hypothetical protein